MECTECVPPKMSANTKSNKSCWSGSSKTVAKAFWNTKAMRATKPSNRYLSIMVRYDTLGNIVETINRNATAANISVTVTDRRSAVSSAGMKNVLRQQPPDTKWWGDDHSCSTTSTPRVKQPNTEFHEKWGFQEQISHRIQYALKWFQSHSHFRACNIQCHLCSENG